MQTVIAREDSLTAQDIEEMAVFGATTFQHDPISIFMNGCQYSENPRFWEAGFRSALQTMGEIGRVYTLREVGQNGSKGKLLALGTCYTPGNESTDRPISKEYKDLLANIPEEQRKFRNETCQKQDEAYEQAYPKGYRRANMHVMDFSVADGYRGQGYGSMLIKHIVADAHKEGVETVLETSKLENVRFYQGRGFQLTGDFDVNHFEFGPLPKKFLLATGIANGKGP